MKLKIEITSTLTSADGSLVTRVTTATETISLRELESKDDFRRSVVNSDAYGKAESLNLDQLEAGFRW